MKFVTMQKRYTFLGYFLSTCYIVLLLWFITLFIGLPGDYQSNGNAYAWILSLVTLGAFALVCVLYWYRRVQFKNRKKIIKSMAAEGEWAQTSGSIGHEHVPDFSLVSLTRLSERRLTRQTNCIYTRDWAYCDCTYDIYRHTKYGDYKESEAVYALMGTTLPRKLPNVMFDSLTSRRRQFKVLYDKSQLHTLEGNFDQHFATYFPKYYTVDSLSFITPDVMETLIEARNYDIEIIDNNLFIFGTVQNPRTQLPEMSQKLAKIKKELLDNILTYRDERLPYDQGRQAVTVEGARLAAAKKKWWIGVVIIIIYSIVRVVVDLQ